MAIDVGMIMTMVTWVGMIMHIGEGEEANIDEDMIEIMDVDILIMDVAFGKDEIDRGKSHMEVASIVV